RFRTIRPRPCRKISSELGGSHLLSAFGVGRWALDVRRSAASPCLAPLLLTFHVSLALCSTLRALWSSELRPPTSRRGIGPYGPIFVLRRLNSDLSRRYIDVTLFDLVARASRKGNVSRKLITRA